jgi:hypothetical protein
MAQKDGSPRLIAAAVAEAGDGEQLDLVPRARLVKSKDKPQLAHGKDWAEQEAKTMEPRRSSDLYDMPRGMLDRSLQAQLGRQLRAIFSDVAEEPVPERFIKLLEALEARERRR